MYNVTKFTVNLLLYFRKFYFALVYLRSDVAVHKSWNSDVHWVFWDPQRTWCPLFQDPVSYPGLTEHFWTSGTELTHGKTHKQSDAVAKRALNYRHHGTICLSLTFLSSKLSLFAMCCTLAGRQYWQYQIQWHHGGGASKWCHQTTATKWHVSIWFLVFKPEMFLKKTNYKLLVFD